jgi:hypothetical protein
MATLVEVVGRVGPTTVNDGTDGTPYRQGNEGQSIQSRLHGAHYENAKRGNVFIAATTPLGIVIPIYTATAPTLVLWNPSDSGKNFTLIRYTSSYVSGTSGVGVFGLSKVFGAGSALGTAAPFSAFVATAPINGLLNAGTVSKAKVSISGTNALTTAGVAADFFYPIYSITAEIVTSALNAVMISHDFEGVVILPPGTAIWTSGTVSSGASMAQSLIWEETPITL